MERQIRIERAKSAFRLSRQEILDYYKLALEQEPQMLINYLVKEIQLFDDKMVIVYNTPRTMSLDESQGFSFYDGNVKLRVYESYGMKPTTIDFRLIMKI